MKVGYIRVSTEEQNTARQEVMMEKLGVDKVFIEKASGKNTDRPELKALMTYLREGDELIVESFSRFARSTRDLLDLTAELAQRGIPFRSLKESIDTSTASGKLMLTMFAALSEFERETMLERQREGIELAKSKGIMGRPQKAIDEPEWLEVMGMVSKGAISVVAACKLLGISRATWYKRQGKISGKQEANPGEQDRAK